jgi:hypothetical protein
MLKKMLVAAMAVMALAAVVAPNASASWLHNHKALTTGENPQETFTGSLTWAGLVGGLHCAVEGKVQLIGGQTTGTVTLFQTQNPAGCHVTGATATACGTTSLQKMELQQHATAQITAANTITITNIKLLNVFGTCTQMLLESDATRDVSATPNNAQTINNVQLGGTLKTAAGNVTVSGTLQAHNVGTYGIKGV